MLLGHVALAFGIAAPPASTTPEAPVPDDAPAEVAAPERAGAAPARGYGGPQHVALDPEADEPDHGAPAEPEAEPEAEPAPEPAPLPERAPEPKPTTYDKLHIMSGPTLASTTFPTPWLKRHRFIYRNFLAGRVNPLGLVDELTLAYRLQLVMKNTRLFHESFLLAGAHVFATPAFVRLGPTIEIQPAAVLNLSATYDFVGAFGGLTQVTSFPSASSNWGPELIRTGVRDGRSYASTGQLLTLSGLFQFQVGKVAVRNNLRAFWSKMKLREGDRVFYDQATDILAPQGGWVITHDTDAVYLFDFGFRVAVRHTVTHAFYDRSDFRAGEPVSQPNGPTLRVGPALAHTFFDRPGVRFNKPTIFLLAQWWYRHRYRTGTEVSAGVPYAAIGFSFEGDLVPSRADTERKRRRGRR